MPSCGSVFAVRARLWLVGTPSPPTLKPLEVSGFRSPEESRWTLSHLRRHSDDGDWPRRPGGAWEGLPRLPRSRFLDFHPSPVPGGEAANMAGTPTLRARLGGVVAAPPAGRARDALPRVLCWR